MSKRDVREAEEAARLGRWDDAGARYAALVERAQRVKDTRTVRELSPLAADAFRRADLPARAAKMLLAARDAGRDDSTDAAQLAGVLLDAGQVEAAADIAASALLKATDPVQRVIALDTAVGLALTRGQVEDARAWVEAIAAIGLPGGEIARRFRVAQLDRLDGLLGGAQAAWEALAPELEAHAQAAGPAGATWAELGELDLLRASMAADPAVYATRALERFTRAGAAWARAGRRVGALRAEAWAARARVMLGETVVAPAIDRAIEYAEERGMPMFSADLRVCRAVVKADPDEVLHAIDRLPEAPLARGRARVVQAELGGRPDLELALVELRPDGPWTARALRALGKVRGDVRLVAEAEERAAGW